MVDLQIKDISNWFNDHLKQEYLFTTKEASVYLGHSQLVNEGHYEPISKEMIIKKLNREGFNCYKSATKTDGRKGDYSVND